MTRYLVLIPIIIIISTGGISVFMPQANGQNLGNNVSAARANNNSDAAESLTVRCPVDPETGWMDCPKVNCAHDSSDPSCPKPFPEDECERNPERCPCNDPSGLSCPQPGRGPTASINSSDFS